MYKTAKWVLANPKINQKYWNNTNRCKSYIKKLEAISEKVGFGPNVEKTKLLIKIDRIISEQIEIFDLAKEKVKIETDFNRKVFKRKN